jgi:competence protein ComEA
MKTWQALTLGISVGLALTAIILIVAIPPHGTPIVLSPPPTLEPIKIFITGAIHQPGLYSLPRGSRVESAITAAGGLTGNADLNKINLAAKIADGDKITIPSVFDPTSQPLTVQATSTPISFPIDINTASLEELDALPGIGNAKAQSIIQYREENGDFQKIEDIMNVPGIGEGIYNNIKELITVQY